MEFNLGEVLNSQRMEAGMNDVTLVCGDINIPAHKTVLCATSNYFRTLFSAKINDDNVPLQKVTAEQMEIVLLFIYTGKLEVEDHNLGNLMAASHFLQINSLTECCFNRLSKTLNCDNFLYIFELASLYYEEGMATHVVSLLAQHFEEIANREEFLHLKADKIQKICLQNIFKCSMDIVVRALFQWAEAGEDQENTYLKIMPFLNLRLLSTEFLLESLQERALVKKNSHILMLMSAEVTVRMSRLALKTLEPKTQMLLTFGCDGEERQVLRMYDVNKNQWLPPEMLPFRLEQRTCVVWFSGHIYVLGGKENFITSTRVIKYCPANNTITAFGSLIVGVYYAGAGVVGEYIYVVNGVNEQIDSVHTVQRYDPVSGTCEKIASTKNSQLFPFIFPFGKQVLVLGSSSGENTIEIYDPDIGKWENALEIPAVIRCSSVAIHETKLFLFPKQLTSKFHVYELTSGEWQEKQFDECARKIREIYCTMLEGKCILLLRDDKNVLRSFDPELGKYLKESTPNDEPWNYYQTCVAHM